jgi:hypothetical protein
MKQIILLLLLLGIVLILMGYMELVLGDKKKKRVEYRFIPRNIYDQLESNNLEEQMSFMNDSNDIRNNNNLI